MGNTLLEKILVPVDGSELSDRILAHVKRILVRADAEVLITQVIPPVAIEGESHRNQALDAARDHVDRLVAGLRQQGARASAHVLVGEPSERLHLFALERRPSLIAMATHGRTGVSRWIRGSVAERMLRTSPFPILASNPFSLGERDELRFRRILVPLDGSEAAAAILPLAAEFARLYDAELILHSAVEVPVVDYPAAALLMTEEDARKLLEKERPRLEGLRVRTSTALGSPAATILDAVEREKADLVAMTTHGRTGVARWAFGSVAETVIRHCHVPLLVSRIPGRTA